MCVCVCDCLFALVFEEFFRFRYRFGMIFCICDTILPLLDLGLMGYRLRVWVLLRFGSISDGSAVGMPYSY